MEPTSTLEEPTNHGETVIGRHGMGVRTPKAAAVAVATKGLARLVHIPKLGTFSKGNPFDMLPTGCLAITPVNGRIFKGAGVRPYEHFKTDVEVEINGTGSLEV